MKKWFGIFVLIVLFSSMFVFAVEGEPDSGISAQEKETVDKIVNNIPIDDSGNFDSSKLAPIKSKAEERIDAINKWLEDRAPWLSMFLGITPAISWLFFVNIYFMLLFMVILVLNSSVVFGFLPRGKEIIAGLILYIILLVTKFYVMLSRAVLELLRGFWATSKVIAIIVIIGFILLLVFAPKVLIAIAKLFKKDEMGEILEKAQVSEKVLNAQVKGMQEKI